jgi:hypothetical protein
MLGGEISGKNNVYPIVYLPKNMNTVAFIRLLNNRMNLVMWEREHPDWREHADFVAQKEKEKAARREACKKNVSNS